MGEELHNSNIFITIFETITDSKQHKNTKSNRIRWMEGIGFKFSFRIKQLKAVNFPFKSMSFYWFPWIKRLFSWWRFISSASRYPRIQSETLQMLKVAQAITKCKGLHREQEKSVTKSKALQRKLKGNTGKDCYSPAFRLGVGWDCSAVTLEWLGADAVEAGPARWQCRHALTKLATFSRSLGQVK